MNRLVVRLVASHVLVAVLGAAATFLIVRQLAPLLFDASLRMGRIGEPGMGQGASGALRQQFADSVDQALLIGALVGAAAAALFGAVAAYGLVRPLAQVRSATRAMASGQYAVPVPIPRERELADLATDVNTLGEALATTEARRVRLLGEVAHEMRTPLTVIDGYVEGMIDGVLPATASELGQVSEEVRRLRRLSENLSALSRAEEGRLGINARQVDLRDLVREAAERLRPQVEDAGLRLAVETGSAAVPVEVDVDRRRPGGHQPNRQCHPGHAAGWSGGAGLQDAGRTGRPDRHGHGRGPGTGGARPDLRAVLPGAGPPPRRA